MYLLNFLRHHKKKFFENSANHLLRIEISKAALEHNINQFKTLFKGQRIGAVLKSNAYGHGLSLMGRFFDDQHDIDVLMVDSMIEAQMLRDVGVKKHIVILGYVPVKIIKALKKIKNVTLVINGEQQAQWIGEHISFPLHVHIKVDTGMNRQGIPLSHFIKTAKILSSNHNVRVEGLLSHLADADNQTSGYDTQVQIEKWNDAVDLYKKFFSRGIFHFSATAGTKYIYSGQSNLIRAGIGLYGFDTTTDKRLQVMRALSLWAKIVNIKNVATGEGIGYNFTFRAKKQMKIATLPCGYYEGVPRCLTNKGFAYFHNIPLPIVGRVSMNLTTVDISDVSKQLSLEDEVEVFSDIPQQLNTIDRAAQYCGTIPYEILVHLAPTIRRILT